jgi:hypothetical protein
MTGRADHQVSTTANELDAVEGNARRLDQRIRLLVGSIGDNLARLHHLVEEAKQGEIHKALGFASWTAYLADALTIQVQLDREQRRELVCYLSGEGMSQRAIATAVNTSLGTVNQDLSSQVFNSEHLPPLDDPAEILAERSTGIDDKSYPRNKSNAAVDERPQRKPRRRPITESFEHFTRNLGKNTASLMRLAADDRFARNGEELAQVNLSDLKRARQRLDEVIARLEGWWDR